ncbi:MAG: hypothetical protein QF922_06275, partial [SAR324 cluster bacterium]|nr:hypothetical protein [SAR324 cluster bacterium]
KVAAAAVLTATAVNLIGCQLLTLSRVDGFLGTFGIHSLAQASKGAGGVSIPCDQLFSPLSPEPDSSGMPFNWQREAREATDRLDRRDAAEGREPRQQNLAAAEEGVVPNVGGTPVPDAPTEATAVPSPRSWLGVVGDWWYRTTTENGVPTTQAQDEVPERVAGDEGVNPVLRATSALGILSSQENVRSRLDPNIRANLQKFSGSRPTKDPAPLGSAFMQDRDGRPSTPPFPVEGLPVPTPMVDKPLDIPTLAWDKVLKITIDLTNQSERCSEGKVCSANIKASSVMTQLSNLMILTHANHGRGCHVGNGRLMEMIAAIDTRIVVFQPPCIPTDWQANQIVHKNMASPHTVHFLGDDLFYLGRLHEADRQPKSQENAVWLRGFR